VHPLPVEGVVKFRASHRPVPLDASAFAAASSALCGWREVLRRLGGVGRDSARYGGAAYGNLSMRVPPLGEPGRGRRRFLVTGTQTGGRAAFALADCCVVEGYDLALNQVTSFGGTPPSSESMTHGAIYDGAPSARAVFHVHSPELWRNARALGLPVSRADVPYGTPEMAREVERLFREAALHVHGIFAMAGHEDGVIAFADSADAAGATLLLHWARALALPGSR
jgi:ribulose-5-phosphate 4-epimerase/fuculose-1-phosphate aldolase